MDIRDSCGGKGIEIGLLSEVYCYRYRVEVVWRNSPMFQLCKGMLGELKDSKLHYQPAARQISQQ